MTPEATSGGRRRRTDDDRPLHPPVALWVRRLAAGIGVLVVVLTLATLVVQTVQAEQARRITEWESCRIDAITRSSVTDDLIAAILAANERIEAAPTYAESKPPRRELDAGLERIRAQRATALADQEACGPRPPELQVAR